MVRDSGQRGPLSSCGHVNLPVIVNLVVHIVDN